MVQPTERLRSASEAADAARALESPVEVQRFETVTAAESAVVRAFLETPEWAAIRSRIMGDGRPPMGRSKTLADVSRRLRWKADGAYSPDHSLTVDERDAYLDAANEIDAFAQSAGRVAPVSPAVPATASSAPANVERLSFAAALTVVKAGGHVARASWPAGSYVTAQAGYPQGIGVNANTAAATGLPAGTVVTFGPYLLRVTTVGGLPPSAQCWAPEQVDLFADDWRSLPRP